MAAKFLKPHPNIGLYGLEYVAEMERAIGVVERAGNENSASLSHAKLCHDRAGGGAAAPELGLEAVGR
jgi:hypothetical protein